MQFHHKRRLALTMAAATTAAVVGASTAASAEDVDVSFVITAAADGLTLSSAAPTADLGSAGFSAASAIGLTGNMPDLTVTDARGSLVSGWSIAASATDFDNAGPAASNAVAFFPVTDVASLITGSTLSGMNLLTCACGVDGATSLLLNDLGSGYTLASGIATNLLSTPTATLAPDFYVNVPAGTAANTYTSTVTFTLS